MNELLSIFRPAKPNSNVGPLPSQVLLLITNNVELHARLHMLLGVKAQEKIATDAGWCVRVLLCVRERMFSCC